MLEIGGAVENRFERFVCSRPDADSYRIDYSNGISDLFTRPAAVGLRQDRWTLGTRDMGLRSQPLSTSALEALMLDAPAAEVVGCFYLAGTRFPDGRSLSITYSADDESPDLLTITDHAGLVLFGTRDRAFTGDHDPDAAPRIAAVDQLQEDGSRVRLASYGYALAEPSGLAGDQGKHPELAVQDKNSWHAWPPTARRPSCALIAHADALGHERIEGF